MESVGFKEWALVCDALGRGESSIILRKGGIAEGRAGFAFRYNEFFLFPTFFHEQLAKTRTSTVHLPEPPAGEIEIRFCAKLEFSRVLTDWETARALERFHILQPEVVRERFGYDQTPGLHFAFVRVLRLAPPWIFPDEPRFGGCRSWLQLPPLPNETKFEAVLSDAEHKKRRAAISALVR